MKKTLFKRILFLASPWLILVVFAIFHSKNSRHAAHERALKEMQEVVAQWAQKKYEPLTDRNSIKTALERLQIGGAPLTPEMREAYSEALVNFLFAFRDGDMESWRRFRFDGSPGTLTPDGIFQVKFYYGLAKLTNYPTAYPDYAPNDKSFLADWYQKIHMTNAAPPLISNEQDMEGLFHNFLQEITYGKVYKDYFDGVCLDEMIAKNDHYTSHPAPLFQYPFFPLTVRGAGQVDSTFPNEGFHCYDNEDPKAAFFSVHPTLTELLSEKGEIDCINTLVYIKINETGKVAPFLLRHMWIPMTKHWAIAEVVDAHISSYNRVMKVIAL